MKRVRKCCSVLDAMSASLARTRAAAAEGARPCIVRSPRSAFTSPTANSFSVLRSKPHSGIALIQQQLSDERVGFEVKMPFTAIG